MRARLKAEGKRIGLIIVLAWLLVASLVFLPVSSQNSLTVEYSPTDDAYVDTAFSSNNYGSETLLTVYDSGGTQRRYAYLKFNLSDIELPVERIVSAKLRLYLTEETSSATTVKVHPYSTNWEEETITAGNDPNLDTSNTLDQQTVQSIGYYEFNVTSHVMNCIGGLCGFALSTESAVWIKFASKEYGVAEAWPTLIIEYQPYNETATQTITETITYTVTETTTVNTTITDYVTETQTTTITQTDTVYTTETAYTTETSTVTQTITDVITETATTTITETYTTWANETITVTTTITPTTTVTETATNSTLIEQSVDYQALADALMPIVLIVGVIGTLLGLLLQSTSFRRGD